MTTPTSKPCAAEPDLWFSDDPDDQYEAIQACHQCPFVFECRVLGDGEIYGVWGAQLQGRTQGGVVQPYRIDCGWCGKEFTVRSRSIKFCGEACKKRAKHAHEMARTDRKPKQHRRRERVDLVRRTCDYAPCGEEFMPVRAGQIFCGKRCSSRATTARARLNALVS